VEISRLNRHSTFANFYLRLLQELIQRIGESRGRTVLNTICSYFIVRRTSGQISFVQNKTFNGRAKNVELSGDLFEQCPRFNLCKNYVNVVFAFMQNVG
jgi:hypothetical protein